MSVVYLEPNTQTNKIKGSAIFEMSEIADKDGAGNTIMLPDESGKIDSILVALNVNGGTARVEWSLSPRSVLKAGGGNWQAWGAGNVAVDASDVFYPVSAVRMFVLSGNPVLEVVAV